ncbi:MAG: ECF transporter S component [Firmicutes bacterium]|nr:ECF transporter S component [Bacillota bacterium]
MVEEMVSKFTTRDFTLIALLAALGMATKPVITPVARMVAGPLSLPGGAVAGGFYMMWLIIAHGLTGKAGSATLVGVVQAAVAGALGMVGSHGATTVLTYTLPGLVADAVFLVPGPSKVGVGRAALAAGLANLSGAALTSFLFFRLPFLPRVVTLVAGGISGSLGGVLAMVIVRKLAKHSSRKNRGESM